MKIAMEVLRKFLGIFLKIQILRFADGLGVVGERRKVKDDEGLSSEKPGVLPSVEMGKTEVGGRFWRVDWELIWRCVNFEMPVKYPSEDMKLGWQYIFVWALGESSRLKIYI